MKINCALFACCVVLACPLAVLADTNCVPPPSGLLSWWPAEGNAGDVAGASAGQLMYGAGFAPGLVGQAFSFNGTNDYVRLPDNLFPFPPNAPSGTPFSFETWFKTPSGGVILGQEVGVPFVTASGWVPGIYVGTDGKLNVEVFWTGFASPVVSTQSVADNMFHHVAVAYDGVAEQVYLDGQLLNNRAFTQVSYGSTYGYQLGVGDTSLWVDGNGGWFPFKGLIDEAALYNRALSSNEVAAIFLAGAAGKCLGSLPPFIRRSPASLDAPLGSTSTLNVGVQGAPPLSYQWQYYGTNLPAATNSTLVLANITATQTGPYSVFISNAFGTAQSGTGVVTVVFPLVLDTVVTNGAPFAGAGNLEVSGGQDVYTFDAPGSRIVYLQVNSAFNRLFWSLTAPDGSAVFTGRYMPNNDVRRLELPMHGTYRLVVYNDSGITGTYSFSVSAVADQTFTISVGNTVTNGVPVAGAGNLEMPGSRDDYLFAAPANGIVYFNVLSAFNRLFWSLFAADGSVVFSQRYMPNNDIGRIQLAAAGNYRLRVYDDDIFTGAYAFTLSGVVDQVFAIAVGDTVTNGVPSAGAGNLETPGTRDDYTFTAPSNRLVYFDVLSAPFRVFWTLYAPDRSTAFSSRYMPNNDIGRVALAQAGTYRLRVYSDNASTGTYSFRLTGITTDSAFAISVGDTVTNGLPALGAGNLEVPGTYDDYFFDATTNPVVYFDVLSAPFRLFWSLAAPDGSAVFSGRYMPNNDVRRVEMLMPGTYRLRVYSDTDATGTYSFRLSNVVDQTINLTVGTVITNGVPSSGAGNLETPGAYDQYLFTAPPNRLVYFNVLSAPYRLFWTLFAPDGSTPFSGRYLPNNDAGRVELPVAGVYLLRIYSDTDLTGPYSFSVSNVVDQRFSISIGSVVTNGTPAPGAGVLQTAGSDDLYTFAANAGQSVHFSDRNSSPRVASWRLVAPGGSQLFNDNLDGVDPGTFTLPVTGTYNLHVRNNSAGAPVSYSFALLNNGTNSTSPPPTDFFNIAIGDTVTNGVPGPGAGNLETAGALDIYTFTGGVGQEVFFEDRGATPNGLIRYDVYDSQWTGLFGEWLNYGQDLGRQTLERGGTYYIVASGYNNTTTGTYSFKIWPVTDQSFNIAIGDTVSNGVPSLGAGNLETPGVHDVYTFTASPGQIVYFEDRGATPNGQIRYDVYDNRGIALFGEWLNGGQDIGRQTLARGGTYTLIVSGYANVTGTYSFKLWPVTGDQAFAINLGDIVANGVPAPGAGNIETPGVHDSYTFTVAPGQVVYFEDLGATPNGYIRYDLYDPENTYVFGEWLNGSQDIGRQRLVRGGTYKLIVSGYVNVTGTYSFKLWSEPADQTFAFNIGDVLTNGFPGVGAGNIEVPGARDIYTFIAAPGQIVYFEDRGATPNGQIRYDVYDDRGVYLFGEWLNSSQDVGRQILTRGGTYTLIASGYADNTGNYSLKIWPVSDQTFALNIGDVVTNGVPAAGAGNIETPDVRDIYTLTANPEQLVYFEDRGASSSGNIRYDVYDSNLTPLFGEWLDNNQGVGLQRLSKGGTYYIVASPYLNITGTYSFRVWDALPHILEQPISARGIAGQPQTFTVKAESPYPLAYQWQLYGTNLPAGTNVLLGLPSPTAAQAGPYDVVISNPYGAVTSVVAMLTLDSAQLYVSAFSPLGPVATNVSALRVQFNSPLLTGSFTPAQVAVTGPSGPLDSGTFTVLPVDSQNFLVTFPAQTVEGAYTVAIGPAITNQAGVGMTGGALFPLYTTDFESGADSSWSRAETVSNAVSSRFLGEFSNDSATLLLAGLPPHSQLRLSWDALIIDNWDGNLNPGPDYFGFNIIGLPQPAWEYTFHESGNPQVQSYPGTPTLSGINFAGQASPDSIYRNLQFDFPHTNDTLDLTFYGRNLRGVAAEGWGLDNVRVRVASASNGVFYARFVIDRTGPLVSVVLPAGTNVLPVNSLTVSFNEPIQPQSLTTNDVFLIDPVGRPIPLNPPVRLSATSFQFSFTAQRTNGLYTVTVGPAVLDLAGNPMASAATSTFNVLTPPVITTQPASATIVRNNNVSFTVVAAATPPIHYQWSFNGSNIIGATTSALTLTNAQTNQSGAYQVVVMDAGGSVSSTPANLTVLPSYGPFIAQNQAARVTVPAVPGNGVFIELFNGIGGGAAPAPSLVSNLVPSGTCLSPVIDFPHPGTVITVGSSFTNFFADTTRPPDQVVGLSALNFILRNTFYLAVSRDDDVHPETPEIDIRLGVGSDDGFYLLVGTNFLGSSSDRSFTYSWMDVSFQDEGLYPITLLYAANAVGQSGLELSWQVGTNAATIIPQSALYVSPNLGDRLITFEEVPAGTVLGNQYAGTGVVFTSLSGNVQVTTNFPTRFVPVSPPNVLADPNANPTQPGIVDLTFVAADGSPAVGFFIINAQNDVPTVTAFDSGGGVLFTNSYHGGGASQQLVTINQPGIARVRVNLGSGTNTAAIDNLALLTPISLPDLVASGITAPASVVASQPVQLVWRVANQGFHAAQGPWTDTVSLSPDGNPADAQLLASVTYSNLLAVGASLTVTQSVIVPPADAGSRWFVVTVNANHAFEETGSLTNNTAVAPAPTQILAPGLAVRNVTGPAFAHFGQTINLSWVVQNTGTAPAIGPWHDLILLSANGASIANAVPLLSVPAPAMLAPGASYTNTQTVTLPLNAAVNPGPYFLFVEADADGAVAEAAISLLTASIALSLPPLPDLAATNLVAPDVALPGTDATLTWTVTNLGTATATGPWTETVLVSPDPTLSNALPVAVLTFTNTLNVADSLTRTQTVTLPLAIPTGDVYFAVTVNSDGGVFEVTTNNNTVVATNATTVPAWLALQLPTPLSEDSLPVTATVTRGGILSQALTVTLTNDSPAHLIIPTNVVIAAGQASAAFPLTPIPDHAVTGPLFITLGASATNFGPVTALLTLNDADSPALMLHVASPTVPEGGTLVATITRSLVDTNGLIVFPQSSDLAHLSLPTTVTIPANQASNTFVLQAIDDGLISAGKTVTVTASAAGYASAPPVSVFVADTDVPAVSVTLAASAVSEGAGPQATTGTVTRTPVSGQPVVVELVSSNTAAAVVPNIVTIPANQASVTFPVAAVNDHVPGNTRQTLITPFVTDSLTGAPIAAGTPALLTVLDNNGPTLLLSLARALVAAGLSPATTGIVLRTNTDTSQAVIVALSSSDATHATVPATVTIPAGQVSAMFSITSTTNGTSGVVYPVTITAAAPGVTEGVAALVVGNVNLPDLVVAGITAPTNAPTESYANISYKILNQGQAATSGSFLTEVFLTQDPSNVTNPPVASYTFPGSLPAGQSFDQTLQVLLPVAAGDYWVVVSTDVGNAVAEILENNNTLVSSAPIHVLAAYEATVAVDLHRAPAGTPVPFHGRAFRPDGTYAAQVPVDIFLTVRGTQRIILAQTDDGGNFTNAFLPLPNEAGFYQIGAAHPGDTSAPAQDTFTLFGMTANPSSLAVTVVEQNSVTGSVAVVNMSEVPLTALGVSVSSQMGNVTGMASLATNSLPGFATNVLNFVLSASDASLLQGTLDLKLTSAEGATLDVPLQVGVVPLRARVSAQPGTLLAGVKPGGQAVVEFDLANLGNTPTAPLSVVTPNLSWLHVATSNPLPPLAAGTTNRVTLQLTPAADLPLGDYNGTLIVQGGGVNLSVPFSFRALSEAKGDLRVTTIDEYTFYAAGSPNLAGAALTVKDAVTGNVLTNGITDTNGQFVVPQLAEGYYEIDATADNHLGFQGTTLVKAGLTNDFQAFLSRETVQYIWTVTPTEIPETFKITIETTFETFVPIPVVTIEPALIDLSQINAEVTQINLRVSNHGLVAANDFHLVFTGNADWQFTPLVSDLGALPAGSSLTVPLTIRRLTPFGPNRSARLGAGLVRLPKSSGGGGCGLSGAGQWTLFCGTTKHYSTPIGIANGGGGCPGGIGGFGGGGTGGLGAPYVSTPFFSNPPNCNTNNCKQIEFAKDVSDQLKEPLKEATDLVNAYIQSNIQLRGFVGKIKFTVDYAKGGARTCCNPPGLELFGSVKATASYTVGPALPEEVTSPEIPFGAGTVSFKGTVFIGAQAKISGSTSGEVSSGCDGKPKWELKASLDVTLKAGADSAVTATYHLGPGDVKPPGLPTASAEFKGGIHFTYTASSDGPPKSCFISDGITLELFIRHGTTTFSPFGPSGSTNLVNGYTICDPPGNSGAGAELRAELPAQADQMIRRAMATHAPATPTASPTTHQPKDAGGICADVRLRLDQDLVLTRSAFNAKLELVNNDPTNPLDNIQVQVNVLDANGAVVNDRFTILTNGLSDISATDGTGIVAPSTTGTAAWLILPAPEAAPDQPATYSVGGYLSYQQGGTMLVVPFQPVPITVYPDPQLHVKYFHQRDVFAQDPFSSLIQPSIPFSLSVMIQNTGHGAAKGVKITSAQPQIIDNQKGLLIDFKIIGTQVAGQNVTPSLTVDFGTINPGQIAIGQWLLTSTLQGLFTDYSATLEHTGGPLDQQLSLIDEVTIHEMIHLVEAPGAFEDGKPDFLVSESRLPPFDLPDTLYLSDGSTNQVQVVQDSTIVGQLSANNLSVQLNASTPTGWTYLNVPDPGNGQFDLTRVVRSDGVEIYFNTNVWTTDRTFIGQGKAPIYEHKLHLLDYNSTGSYQLFYQMPHPADTIPPSSRVAALPAQSFDEFPVTWSGQDNPGGSGLAYFDVYVSDNGGAFVPWVTQTVDTGDTFFGTLGHTYAFYSVATDNAGNHEAGHTTPDAQTTVSLVNQPAILDPIPDQIIHQGDTLHIVATGHDPDGETLTFSLVGNAPAGVQIDPATGLITWITAGSTLPGTNQITVQVLDSGTPREGMTRTFNVVVLSAGNTPPLLEPITDRTIREGSLLMITNAASDSDFPPQTLTFSLGPGAPTNAVIDPATGIFQWQPTHTQSDTTNRISVIVTDNGTPPLSATQSFTVIVIRVLPDFVLSLGNTNLMVGESGVVLLTLASTFDFTNISFEIEASADRVTNLVLQPASSEVVSATLQALGADAYAGSLTLNPALQRAPVRPVASLAFATVTNAHSAIVPLALLSPIGKRLSGQPLTNSAAFSGRVIIVGAEPVMDLSASLTLTLYGHPGAAYMLQYRTNAATASWLDFNRLTLSGRFLQVTNLPSPGSMTFYRAYELPAFGLGLQSLGGSAFSLSLQGRLDAHYRVQTATNLNVPANWSDLFSVTLTNSPEIFNWTNPGDTKRFFRTISP